MPLTGSHIDGWTAFPKIISAASTNATVVKASPGKLGGWYLFNSNAAVRYLKVYNKATTPTVGADVPLQTLPILPGGGANIELEKGIVYSAGISVALTTGVADNDTAAVAANEIVVNLLYL